MNRLVLLSIIIEIIGCARCESELTGDDHSVVRGIAAKIGFSPTVLKVFVKGDIQPEEIEKLLKLCSMGEKGINDTGLSRSRRNSISNYIGKLYSFNNLFRPYRSVFRGATHDQTTKIPWLRKILGVPVEPRTENFWGMALGAHTFSPFSRPLAQTRMPYHRYRDQQRMSRLLEITGNPLNTYEEKEPYHWIRDKEKFGEFVGQAKNDEIIKTMDHQKKVTTRRAFHRAPLDVAGVKPTFIPHLHAFTTPKRIKFCEKQCADEPEQPRTKRPPTSSDGEPKSTSGDESTPSAHQSSTDESEEEYSTTGSCSCTVTDCLCDRNECERNCNGHFLNLDDSGQGNPKNMVQKKRKPVKTSTKVTTLKITTSRFTKSKKHRPTGPVWTLPPNSVLDEEEATKDLKRPKPATSLIPEAEPESKTQEYSATTVPSTGHYWTGSVAVDTVTPRTRKVEKTSKKVMCVPLPIPTRVNPPHFPRTTGRCTKPSPSPKCDIEGSQTLHEDFPIPLEKHTSKPSECTRRPNTTRGCTKPFSHKCECLATSAPFDDIPISIGDSLEDQDKTCKCNKGKPQKIIVRISSTLGEVPVVIMRDNGVSGVSLTLVNDYLLDQNNRLIKCLGKPLSRHVGPNDQSSTMKRAPHSRVYNKNKKFLPNFIRHQLHSLQPKRYSLKLGYKPEDRLISVPRASFRTGNEGKVPNDAMNPETFLRPRIPNNFNGYALNPPDSHLAEVGRFGFQYPSVIQNSMDYQGFKMEPAALPNVRLDPIVLPLPQVAMDTFSSKISPPEFLKPRAQQVTDLGNLPAFGPPGRNIQPGFPPQAADALMGYRSPFLPLFYQNKNNGQPGKYIGGIP